MSKIIHTTTNFKHHNRVYIGLGANLDNPSQQLEDAISTLSQLEKCQLIKCSSFYQSTPMGPQDQDDYINAVALLSTELSPIQLLDQLQKIELQHGRKRKKERWGARTLDLDILLYNNEVIDTPRLTIPHYGMKQRNFVLLPLSEIAPELMLPDGASITELIDNITLTGICKL